MTILLHVHDDFEEHDVVHEVLPKVDKVNLVGFHFNLAAALAAKQKQRQKQVM